MVGECCSEEHKSGCCWTQRWVMYFTCQSSLLQAYECYMSLLSVDVNYLENSRQWINCWSLLDCADIRVFACDCVVTHFCGHCIYCKNIQQQVHFRSAASIHSSNTDTFEPNHLFPNFESLFWNASKPHTCRSDDLQNLDVAYHKFHPPTCSTNSPQINHASWSASTVELC